jgi:hypothetical protein
MMLLLSLWLLLVLLSRLDFLIVSVVVVVMTIDRLHPLLPLLLMTPVTRRLWGHWLLPAQEQLIASASPRVPAKCVVIMVTFKAAV